MEVDGSRGISAEVYKSQQNFIEVNGFRTELDGRRRYSSITNLLEVCRRTWTSMEEN